MRDKIMPKEGLKRKLTAIFSADVEGYSRLMGNDEVGTIRTLTAYKEAMTGVIKQNRGRVVDAPGDNLLAEFASVVDAVQCAVEIQQKLAGLNNDLPVERMMQFRIGVNLGDVVEEGDRIYGDGVNIAARIEGLASGGGICISRSAYGQVKNKLNVGYEYLGEHTVKNITEPVSVYRVLTEPEAAGKIIGEKRIRLTHRHWAAVAAIVLVLVAAAAAIWNFYIRSAPTLEKDISSGESLRTLSNKASIAVLPFTNLSGDPEQEYFSDGITNDIITDLSKFSSLLVIASNTVFTYKGKPVKVKKVGQELGVRYILEGSVQKLSQQVRINAQLIDAATEHHLWAERYDSKLKDLFALQDEIVQTIVATLAIQVGDAEKARAIRKDTASLEAYDYILRGWHHLSRDTRSANVKAKEMFRMAIELDPDYSGAYSALGYTYLMSALSGFTEFSSQALKRANDLALKALSLEKSNDSAHALLGTCYLYQGEYDLAISSLQRAIELNPNDPDGYHSLGWVLLFSSRTDEAIKALETTLRLNPNTFAGSFYFLGLGYYLTGRYDDAIRTLKQGLSREPNHTEIHIALAASYAQVGRLEKAASAAKMVHMLQPIFEVEAYGMAFRNPADRERIRDGLRKAGLK
jgi:adenylate cyclase